MNTSRNIRVGQRLIKWDGTRGFVSLSSIGKLYYAPGESFKIEWLGENGKVEDTEYCTQENLCNEGISLGRGVMPWAK